MPGDLFKSTPKVPACVACPAGKLVDMQIAVKISFNPVHRVTDHAAQHGRLAGSTSAFRYFLVITLISGLWISQDSFQLVQIFLYGGLQAAFLQPLPAPQAQVQYQLV